MSDVFNYGNKILSKELVINGVPIHPVQKYGVSSIMSFTPIDSVDFTTSANNFCGLSEENILLSTINNEAELPTETYYMEQLFWKIIEKYKESELISLVTPKDTKELNKLLDSILKKENVDAKQTISIFLNMDEWIDKLDYQTYEKLMKIVSTGKSLNAQVLMTGTKFSIEKQVMANEYQSLDKSIRKPVFNSTDSTTAIKRKRKEVKDHNKKVETQVNQILEGFNSENEINFYLFTKDFAANTNRSFLKTLPPK